MKLGAVSFSEALVLIYQLALFIFWIETALFYTEEGGNGFLRNCGTYHQITRRHTRDSNLRNVLLVKKCFERASKV
jgi:hypothetical protein